jgi:hypothetical protein
MRENSFSGVARNEALREATCFCGSNEPMATTQTINNAKPPITTIRIFTLLFLSFDAAEEFWLILQAA